MGENVTPPHQLKIGQVPKYLKNKYDLDVTRQTVYNWISKGLRNDSLQYVMVKGKPTSRHPHVRVTTEEWVDSFLRRCRIELPQA